MTLKWDLEEILWNLLPGTLRVGVQEILPERINLRSAEDLRDFIRVFTGRSFCDIPTIGSEDFEISIETSGLLSGGYVYQFTAYTEFGETLPSELIFVSVLDDDSHVTWTFTRNFCRRAAGVRVYRSERVGYGSTIYGLIAYGAENIGVPVTLKYIVEGIPDEWTDDGTDPDDTGEIPPTRNTATFDPDYFDRSVTLDEIRNKIRRFHDLVDPDMSPEEILNHLFYFMYTEFDPSKETEPQTEEYKKRFNFYQMKGTIPSVHRVLRKTRHDLGIHEGETLDRVYEPYVDIARYSMGTFSGSPILDRYGIRKFSTTGTLKIIDNPSGPDQIILEDLLGSPFVEAQEGYFIQTPSLGGPTDGFKIAVVLDDNTVEIPQGIEAWGDPLYRDMGSIENVQYYLLAPLPREYHITSWEYYHHGVYEIQSTLNPVFYREEIRDFVHVAGTRLWFLYILEMLLEEIDIGFKGEVNEEVELIIQPDLNHFICGAIFSDIQYFSELGSYFSGCMVTYEEVELTIDMGRTGVLPAAVRRTPWFTPVLRFYDLYGTVGWLDNDPGTNQFVTRWSVDEYRWNDDIPYLDAQPPHILEKVVHTGGIYPSITKGAPNGMDAFVPPVDLLVTGVIQVNQLGAWDNGAGAFLGGTDYVEGVDWVFYVDDTVYPHLFYIDWSPGGAEPAPASSYDIVYSLES